MRNRLFLSLLAATALVVASAASAGTLTSASWLQTSQGLVMDRTTAQLGATGTSTGSSIAVNRSYPQCTSAFFIPKAASGVLDLHIKITEGGAQAISATAGNASGTPGIPGTVIVMTAAHVGMGVNQSNFNPGINTLVAVPVNVGKAGTVTGYFTVLGAGHTITCP
jgi:hypothetical protein